MLSAYVGFRPEWHMLLVVAAVILLLFAAKPFYLYIILPIRLRRRGALSLNVRYEPVELTDLPPDIGRPFFEAAPQLAALGFSALAHVRPIQDKVRESEGINSIWLNSDGSVRAQVTSIKAEIKHRPPVLRGVVAFATDFTDGTAIVTSNRAVPRILEPLPAYDGVHCPHLGDLSLLHRLHLARVKQSQGARSILDFKPENVIEHVRRERDRLVKAQVSAAYYKLDAQVGVYRKTIRGAFITTWRALWPLQQINYRKQANKLRRVVAECDLGPVEQFLPSVWAPLPPPLSNPAIERLQTLAGPREPSKT